MPIKVISTNSVEFNLCEMPNLSIKIVDDELSEDEIDDIPYADLIHVASDEIPVAKGRFGWDLSGKTVTVVHFRRRESSQIVLTILVPR